MGEEAIMETIANIIAFVLVLALLAVLVAVEGFCWGVGFELAALIV